MKKTNLRSNNLRFSSADPYLKWLVTAVDSKDEGEIQRALVNAKTYLKTAEKKLKLDAKTLAIYANNC